MKLIHQQRGPLGGNLIVPCLNFKSCCFTYWMRRMPCRCWYFTIVFALFSVAFTISTHLCRLSPFLLTYVAVSRPCRLSEFYHNRVQTFSPVLPLVACLVSYMVICQISAYWFCYAQPLTHWSCPGFVRARGAHFQGGGGGGGLMQTYKHKQTRAVRLHSENFKFMSSEMAINASRTANSSRSL